MPAALVLALFALVYVALALGGLPGLRLGRSGVALLAAAVLVLGGALSPAAAWRALDLPTLGLLLGLMVVSAQFRLGGAYDRLTRALGAAPLTPPRLLGLWILAAAGLSALLANDVVCLAATPVLVESCARRRLDPVPFLVALACASNVGSAATLIGNPQNMLIGETLELSFAGYLASAAAPVALGLVATWVVIAFATRGRWRAEAPLPALEPRPWRAAVTARAALVLVAMVALFLWGTWPRELVALGGAALLLVLSPRDAARSLRWVDLPLIGLFVGLFVVHGALDATAMPARALGALEARGLELARPAPLFGASVVLSNLVSNVPATMLLLPIARRGSDPHLLGTTLALASTLAGNLVLVGSIANLIVAEQAQRVGVRLDWRRHARLGAPVTLLTLAIAALWLALVA